MKIVALDTETGGLDPAKNALLSISLVEFDTDELVMKRSLDLLILPHAGKTITVEAAKVNGYAPEAWAERRAIALYNAMVKVAQWLPKGAAVVAHNAGFDKAFFSAAEQDTGVKTYLGYAWRCSMTTFRAVNDALGLGYPDAKLETLAKAAGHWRDGSRGTHKSIDDALACAAGYAWLLKVIKQGATHALV